MLVLMRRKDERVVINPGKPDEIVVTVIEIQERSGKVRLGFQAVEDVIIHRAEIVDAIRAAEREGGA